MDKTSKNPLQRRSPRLQAYDYSSPGAYFVTVCTHARQCLFGDILNGRMHLNDASRMVQAVWNELPVHYPNVETDAFVVMPNHVHGIIVLTGDTVGAAPCGRPDPRGRPDEIGQAQGPAPTLSLPDVVHRFKTMTTRRYIEGVKRYGWPPFYRHLWQRSFYEHVVRRTDRMNRIREYIVNNPARWVCDQENLIHGQD